MRKKIILRGWLPALCFAFIAAGALVGLAVLAPNSPNAHPDTRPPVISDISIHDISENAAQVTWATDEPATTEITWFEENGGFNAASEKIALGPSAEKILSTSHTILIVGLQPGKTYAARVISTDAAGNETISAEIRFVTPRLLPPSS